MSICTICNYQTDRPSNYIKHLETEKHKLKVISNNEAALLVKEPVCNYCQITMANDKLLINHVKLCPKNPKNKLCKCCNLVFNKEFNYVNHMEFCYSNKITELDTNHKNKITELDTNHKNKITELDTNHKNKITELENSITKLEISNKKIDDEFKKYLYDNANRANNSVSNTSNNTSLNLYFNNAPPIKQIDNFDIYDKNLLTEDGYVKFIDELIYYSEHKLLPKFIGDHIIKTYKKDDMKDQSLWNTDTSRLNYIIKKAIENGWYQDKKGNEFVKLCVEPLLKVIEYDIREQIRLLAIASRDVNLSGMEALNMNKKCEKLNDIVTKLESNKLANEILIYVSPFFHLDKKFIEEYKKNSKTINSGNDSTLFIEYIESESESEVDSDDISIDENETIISKSFKKITSKKPIIAKPVKKTTDKETIIAKPIISKKITEKEPIIAKPVISKKITDKETIIAKRSISKKTTDKEPIIVKPVISKKIIDKETIIVKPVISKKTTDKELIIAKPVISKKITDKETIIAKPEISKKITDKETIIAKPIKKITDKETSIVKPVISKKVVKK